MRRVAVRLCVESFFCSAVTPHRQVDRKAAHELAVPYGLLTQSYDLEPKRYVSVIKQKVTQQQQKRTFDQRNRPRDTSPSSDGETTGAERSMFMAQ